MHATTSIGARCARIFPPTKLTLCIALVAQLNFGFSAHAFFHLWRFTEFFSSANGDVQFIELRATANNENFSQNAQIRSQSTGNTFVFPSNLASSQTANKFLLVATAGFGSLAGGVTPDFILPADFFDPAGDTLILSSGFDIDSKTFASVPTDGIASQNYFPTNGSATNTPTNFTGATGSVNLAPPATTGDYNGDGTVDAADYTVWRDTLGQPASPHGSGADGDADGTIDNGDYTFWKNRFGNSVPGSGTAALNASAVPEPRVFPLALFAASCCPWSRLRKRAA